MSDYARQARARRVSDYAITHQIIREAVRAHKHDTHDATHMCEFGNSRLYTIGARPKTTYSALINIRQKNKPRARNRERDAHARARNERESVKADVCDIR